MKTKCIKRFQALNWEEKLLKIRPELRKAGTVFEEDKNKIIRKQLQENPQSPIEELDKALANAGFYGIVITY